MLIKKPQDLTYKDVTPKGAYANRRNFLLGLLATTCAVAGWKKFSYLVSGPVTGSIGLDTTTMWISRSRLSAQWCPVLTTTGDR